MAQKYSCKNCGAEIYFDPKTGKMHCDYCDADYDPSEYGLDASGNEIGKEEKSGNDAEHYEPAEGQAATDDSYSTDDLVVYTCPNCGAEMITSKKTVATTCIYCNRAVTLTGNLKGSFRPDYVLPFRIPREKVAESYKKLCKKTPLTPRLFSSEATVKKIKGVYVPFWLYSFEGQVELHLHAERARTFRTGDDEVTEISTYEIRESGEGSYEQVPADAMKKMDNELMDAIEPFDLSKMVPFQPAYLTGFYAQHWDDDAASNETRATDRAKKALKAEAMKNVGIYTTRIVESENEQFKNVHVKSAMLPVWMLYMQYRGKEYVFGMNGQSGRMLGRLPKDPLKIVKASVAAFILSQIVMMVIRVIMTLM